ncbi:hypothetical protein [Desulforapulum autotrophicum]|uniref:hypothetical protein n=1 Tax=Desulforapulum autotrophicum TaxID=2296 RepID=UPI00059C55BD|nr:hypothetical protein [Desulforapulum autotrophicum]
MPFQTKAQELRAKVLKQPALLNAWKGKNPNPFGLQCSSQGNQRGLESRDFHNDVSTRVSYKKSAVPYDGAVPRASIAVQTYGDFQNFNPHLYAIVSDGCFIDNDSFRISEQGGQVNI